MATSTNQPAVVIERAVTATTGDDRATTVLLGATPRQDGYLASTWYIGASPDEPTSEALVVYNADNTAGTVSVSAVGSSGPVPVESLEDLTLEPASLLTIDLTDPLVAGRSLVVESTNRIFVERSFPSGRGDTRSSSWAVPAG
jgi:hypothetical protein